MATRIEGIEEDELRYLHDEEIMAQQEIAEYYNVSRATVWRRMIEYGIERRTKSEAFIGNNNGASSRIYSINEDFFNAWTAESAWMYGWALGDGGYRDIHNLEFGLARVDREVLEKFKSLLGSEHPIKDYESWSDKYQKYYKMSKITFSSKKLVTGLKKLTLYDVPECYFNHFLRGFFEAEGSVFWIKRNTPKGGSIGSNISQNDEDLLDFILWCLHEFKVVERGFIYPYKNNWKMILSVNDSISLYHYMYDNCSNMYLKRKKEKFEEIIGRQEM